MQLIKASLSGARQDRDVGFHHPGFARSKGTLVSRLSRQAGNTLAVIAFAICQMNYKFALSRPVEGEIKTVTIKRDNAGRLFVCFSVIQEMEPSEVSTNKIGGFDFGLKTFLTDDEGHTYQSPEVYRSAMREIARLNRSLARKQRDSGNWKKAKRSLALAHSHLANKRRDSHFKLANRLLDEYGILCFEDLHIEAIDGALGAKGQ